MKYFLFSAQKHHQSASKNDSYESESSKHMPYESKAVKPTKSGITIKYVGKKKDSIPSESDDELPLFSKTYKLKENGKTNHSQLFF